MLDNFFTRQANGGAVFTGRTLIQAHGSIGGHKNVFVKLVKGSKDALCYPTTGGILKNPFKGRAKIYAGDLIEYTPNINNTTGAEVKILKFYESAKEATSSDVTIKIVRDGYSHIPFVGDNIMVGQKDFTTKAKAVSVTRVEKSTETGVDVWILTLSETLGVTIKKGDILVEAAGTGASVLPMVTNPNSYADKDMDFLYDVNMEGVDELEYMLTPALAQEDTVIDLVAIGNLPPAVLALNKSRVKTWFWFN